MVTQNGSGITKRGDLSLRDLVLQLRLNNGQSNWVSRNETFEYACISVCNCVSFAFQALAGHHQEPISSATAQVGEAHDRPVPSADAESLTEPWRW